MDLFHEKEKSNGIGEVIVSPFWREFVSKILRHSGRTLDCLGYESNESDWIDFAYDILELLALLGTYPDLLYK